MVDKPCEGSAGNKLLKFFFSSSTVGANEFYYKNVFSRLFYLDVCHCPMLNISDGKLIIIDENTTANHFLLLLFLRVSIRIYTTSNTSDIAPIHIRAFLILPLPP